MRSNQRKSSFLVISMVLAACALAGCVSSGPDQFGPPLDRRDLVVQRVEQHLEEGKVGAAIDRLTYGLHRELLEPEWVRETLQGVFGQWHEEYRQALADEDYSLALQARWNLAVLQEDPLNVGTKAPPELLQEDSLSRDDLLLRWAGQELDREEPVLALYLLLRRSTLDDLGQDEALRFLEIARTFNNDEAAERILKALKERDEGDDLPPLIAVSSRTPPEMLAGTVTVWVNRGMRISQGVGVPDRGIGSGFFIDPRGYLLTNYHVIYSEVDPTYNGFSRLYVKLAGRPNERIPARVIGYDRVFDLALLKVELDAPYVFSLSDTRRLTPGERVLALGSPGGLDSTITAGIVSAEGRRFFQMGEAVQIDAPVNPGNSGGPLILPDGQVAGIVFAGIPQFEGVNFAIPSYWVRHFFPRLFLGGEVVHPWLGFAVHAGREGLRVVYVAPGSPAHRAGVREGEILRSIQGRPVKTLSSAQDIILERRPGDLLHTRWSRENRREEISRVIALDSRPFSPVEEALKRQPIEALFPVLFGMNVEEISSPPWGPDYVITEVFPGTSADESSLSPNDPFSLRNWRVDTDLRAAFIQIVIKKRKAGFLESGLQLGSFLETDSFL
ncbi:serine protease, S1-C subfamily, contains C-terminal PDZ domain [Alkalispirochaeta americana]|uniref:Serine protease, S1-C subfamily, contains C-terminal PDZ domain n=1 Tax=Alkalispirochaeta americana TaxID=159291 RepID=A0A1N6R052_9SPIO|nr:trypsin-like peptidase domain-containing protein [Alkalispirochaeta americana]SIQ21976.1 serine protease, S1-C subfamily, contains C-terminal PDZ domain [Alkalispirochaeta americana]